MSIAFVNVQDEEKRNKTDCRSPSEEQFDPYLDERWREIILQPFGARWTAQHDLLSFIAHDAEAASKD